MSKKKILTAKDDTIEPIEITQWGGTFHLKVMSGRDRDSLDNLIQQAGGQELPNYRAEFLVRCFCDDEGKRLFTNEEAAALGEKNSLVLKRAFARAMKLNKWGETEDLKKGS